MERLNFFPQIFRKFAAKILKIDWRWLVLAFLTFFFLVNLGDIFWPKNSFERVQISILKTYQNPKSHLELAQIYLKNNDLENAQREILIAESFLKNHPLPEAVKFKEFVEEKINEPRQIQREIAGWEKISQDFPGYRDAYLKLAQLYFKLYQNDKARENLDKALELDPNFEATKRFKSLIED